MQALSQLSYSPTKPRTLRLQVGTVKKPSFSYENKILLTPVTYQYYMSASTCGCPRLYQSDRVIEAPDRTLLPNEP